MRVLVFGGRTYHRHDVVFEVLDELRERHLISQIIEGGAGGADALGRTWAALRRLPRVTVQADWSNIDHPDAVIKHGRFGPYDARAGFRRNQKMIDEYRPDLAVQFPGGSGTADMRRRLNAAGISVVQIYEQAHDAHQPRSEA